MFKASGFARRALQKSPLWLLKRIVHRSRLAFCYHVVSDKPLPHIRHLYRTKSVAAFEQDLDYLERNFDLCTYEDWIAPSSTRRGRTKALLTFDDGMAECFDTIRPILLRRGIPGVFFLVSEFI